MGAPYLWLLAIVAAIFIAVLCVVWFRGRGPASAEAPAEGWLNQHPNLQPRYLEFDDERIFFIQTGKGPDVVLLHGIGASVFIWRFLILLLSKNYRVTALDIPGFGRSSKKADVDYGLDAQRKRINVFLDALKIRRAYLVGSSMGGAIALWMSHEDPLRYPKVATLAPATSPELIPRRLSKLVAHAPFAYKTLNHRTMGMILGYVVSKRELINSETIEAYLEPYLDRGVSVRTFLAALQLLGDRRMPKCFEGMRSKILIIQGERDRLVKMRSILRLAKVLGSAAVLVTCPDGGHHIMEDEPEWTAAELGRFFATSE